MSDPGTSYRTREEVQEVRQTRDPITSFKEKIITSNLVTADEIKVTHFTKHPRNIYNNIRFLRKLIQRLEHKLTKRRKRPKPKRKLASTK